MYPDAYADAGPGSEKGRKIHAQLIVKKPLKAKADNNAFNELK